MIFPRAFPRSPHSQITQGGQRVGVIVNDVAAINIDSKLVIAATQQSGQVGDVTVDTSDVVELQNGCACCSASDELLESVLKLLLVAANKVSASCTLLEEMVPTRCDLGEPTVCPKVVLATGAAVTQGMQADANLMMR